MQLRENRSRTNRTWDLNFRISRSPCLEVNLRSTACQIYCCNSRYSNPSTRSQFPTAVVQCRQFLLPSLSLCSRSTNSQRTHQEVAELQCATDHTLVLFHNARMKSISLSPDNSPHRMTCATSRFSNLRDSNTIRFSRKSLARTCKPRSISPKFSNPDQSIPQSSTQEDNQWRSASGEPAEKRKKKWQQERGRGLQRRRNQHPCVAGAMAAIIRSLVGLKSKCYSEGTQTNKQPTKHRNKQEAKAWSQRGAGAWFTSKVFSELHVAG